MSYISSQGSFRDRVLYCVSHVGLELMILLPQPTPPSPPPKSRIIGVLPKWGINFGYGCINFSVLMELPTGHYFVFLKKLAWLLQDAR